MCVHEKTRFDLILLDMLMPGLNGIQTAENIRKYDAQTPIIFATTTEDFAVQSYRVLAFDYLLKPVTAEDMPRLLLIIRGILSVSFGLVLIFSMTEFRFSKKRSIFTIVLFFIFSICANVVMLRLVGYGVLSKIMTILLTTWLPVVVLLIYLSKDRFFKCLFTIGMVLGIFCTIYWISSFFIRLIHGGLMADILIRAVLYGLTLFICHRYVKKKYRLFVDTINRYWGLISITSILLALFFVLQIDTAVLYFDAKTYICLAFNSVLMLLMYVLVFLTFQNTHDLMLKSQIEQTMKQQIALQKEQYNAVQNKIEVDKAFRHDLRHHANLLTGMLTEGKMEDALTYVQKLGTFVLDNGGENYCENMVVNTILAYHVQRAKAVGMMVACKAVVPEKISIDEMELCTALSNLLENAIQHSGGASSQLTISILQNKEQLCIRIENSFDGMIERDEHGNYRSTKPQGGGIGLQSVAAIVKKHEGAMNVSHTATTFTVDIALNPIN